MTSHSKTADLADIVKRHETVDRFPNIATGDAHKDRAALIAMVKEAHAALRPLANMRASDRLEGKSDGYEFFTESADVYGLRGGVFITVGHIREAARILAVRE